MKNHIYILILIILIFSLIGIHTVKVNDENGLKKLISNDGQDLLIEINKNIEITNDITINKSFQKISIVGNSLQSSSLNFKNLNHKIYFGINVKEIVIKKVSIIGNLFFNNTENVTINSVALYGTIQSDFENNNNISFKISNFKYVATTENSNLIDHCIYIGGNLSIEHSEFLGSSSCLKRMLYFKGLNNYSLTIKNSHFDGNYSCPCLTINRGTTVNVVNSIFEKGYTHPSTEEGGAGINILYSKSTFNNCTFSDNLSSNSGGAFVLYNIYEFSATDINVYNTTALYNGSMAQVRCLNEVKYPTKFKNVRQINSGNVKGITQGGFIMNLEGSCDVDVQNYYAENLINEYGQGSAFVVTGYSSLNITNIYINELTGNAVEGLFINTYNVLNVDINVYNYTLSNFRQYSDRKSGALLWLNNYSNIVLKKGIYKNITGNNLFFSYISEHSQVNIDDLTVDNYKTKRVSEFFALSSSFYPRVSLVIKKLKLYNIISRGPLFSTSFGSLEIYNSEIKNIHLCDDSQDCGISQGIEQYIIDTGIAIIGGGSNVIIENTVFDNIHDVGGILLSSGSTIKMSSNTFKNSFLKNGLIKFNTNSNFGGQYLIENSKFINITSEYGSVIYIEKLKQFFWYKNEAIFTNSKFINNTATKYGGVIYSKESDISESVVFTDCVFENNKASVGSISYCLDINSEPEFTNLKQLRKIDRAFATNPTSLRMNNENLIKNISFYSGEKIPEGISCSLYDDYNKVISLESDASNIDYDEFIFFSLSINDTYNAEIHGQYQSYCWGESCEIPPVKVIGNPGNYIIRMIINTFGEFSRFQNNYIDIPIEIKPCNSSYINQYMESPKIKSCYSPKCDPLCYNLGKCVNINVCDCRNTSYTGDHCDQFYKLNRIKVLDNFIQSISYLLIFLIILTTIMTLYQKKHPYIKGGGVDFLILILIGSIIKIIFVLFLVQDKTTNICYFLYLFDNSSFSLVFGSILVKALRIYKIFGIGVPNKKSYGLNKITMYFIILSILVIHLFFCLLWYKLNLLNAKPFYTNSNQEYYKCVYPKSSNITMAFNYFILIYGCFLSYSIRNVEKNFRENLTVPVYIYVIFRVLLQIIEIQNISIIVQDFLNEIGTSRCKETSKNSSGLDLNISLEISKNTSGLNLIEEYDFNKLNITIESNDTKSNISKSNILKSTKNQNKNKNKNKK
ncbi:hypothetical protein BCR32DRAFT_291626 [Anaeromyces robustus]|uniref:G-protein coupled receptors family 3 profile domain-containing protein n=1 Tax=Anaeromyces robustus TaxID=1754192 RepID=A0A1Y1XE35_9FUNG|nr:hypothetical protein BCR32DRAFT_291626 [Anaeromyces robustus]|eukprot:ORX84041.1 hypothetical protein BCR32DRAFT_291626 [Anaeromyces robustus]